MQDFITATRECVVIFSESPGDFVVHAVALSCWYCQRSACSLIHRMDVTLPALFLGAFDQEIQNKLHGNITSWALSCPCSNRIESYMIEVQDILNKIIMFGIEFMRLVKHIRVKTGKTNAGSGHSSRREHLEDRLLIVNSFSSLRMTLTFLTGARILAASRTCICMDASFSPSIAVVVKYF
jgi:hypothetical protein